MWKCESCHKEFEDKTMALEVKFGYVNEDDAKKYTSFYIRQNNAFNSVY